MNASSRLPIVLLPGMDGTGELLDAPHMLLETHPDEAAEAIDEFCVCL